MVLTVPFNAPNMMAISKEDISITLKDPSVDDSVVVHLGLVELAMTPDELKDLLNKGHRIKGCL